MSDVGTVRVAEEDMQRLYTLLAKEEETKRKRKEEAVSRLRVPSTDDDGALFGVDVVRGWTTNDVCDWLCEVHLDKFVAIFHREGITGLDLSQNILLKHNVLISFGITRVLDQERIREAVSTLHASLEKHAEKKRRQQERKREILKHESTVNASIQSIIKREEERAALERIKDKIESDNAYLVITGVYLSEILHEVAHAVRVDERRLCELFIQNEEILESYLSTSQAVANEHKLKIQRTTQPSSAPHQQSSSSSAAFVNKKTPVRSYQSEFAESAYSSSQPQYASSSSSSSSSSSLPADASERQDSEEEQVQVLGDSDSEAEYDEEIEEEEEYDEEW